MNLSALNVFCAGILTTILFWVMTPVMAAEVDLLAGIWKQSGKDIWLEIKFDQAAGTGRVIRNDKRPESVGKPLLTELTSSSDEGKGEGLMYVPQTKSRHRATLRLAGAKGMTMKVKVGFMSKTVDWLRVEDNTQPQK